MNNLLLRICRMNGWRNVAGTAALALFVVAGCGKRKDTRTTSNGRSVPAFEKASACAHGATMTTFAAAISSRVQGMQAGLQLGERALGDAMTNMDEEAIAHFVSQFADPAQMDTIMWENYINNGTSSRYVVAENIFRWMVDHCQDERSQAYARNHLGHVLSRQGRLEEALAMYESVQLQSSSQDFWYVDAKDEAGMIAYSLIGVEGSGYDAVKKCCQAAERNYMQAIAVTDRENVKAALYFKLGHVYVNTDPNKAQEAWRMAYRLARKSGKESLAMEAKDVYDHYRSNTTFCHRLQPKNKEPL